MRYVIYYINTQAYRNSDIGVPMYTFITIILPKLIEWIRQTNKKYIYWNAVSTVDIFSLKFLRGENLIYSYTKAMIMCSIHQFGHLPAVLRISAKNIFATSNHFDEDWQQQQKNESKNPLTWSEKTNNMKMLAKERKKIHSHLGLHYY